MMIYYRWRYPQILGGDGLNFFFQLNLTFKYANKFA